MFQPRTRTPRVGGAGAALFINSREVSQNVFTICTLEELLIFAANFVKDILYLQKNPVREFKLSELIYP